MRETYLPVVHYVQNSIESVPTDMATIPVVVIGSFPLAFKAVLLEAREGHNPLVGYGKTYRKTKRPAGRSP